jgi:hypothetical protein
MTTHPRGEIARNRLHFLDASETGSQVELRAAVRARDGVGAVENKEE